MGTLRTGTRKLWDGVRMRRALARPDPDGPAWTVTVPASWPDTCADALAAIGTAADLRDAAEAFLAPLAAHDAELAGQAHALLLRQAAAPALPAWIRSGGSPGVVLNLAAAVSGADGSAAIIAAAAMARALWPGRRPTLALTGLADWLAAEGLDYATPAAREAAVALVAALRRHAPDALLVVAPPGPADALLGVETAGVAPAFGALAPDGGLSRGAMAFLAARGLSPEAALATALAGGTPVPVAPRAAHAAMCAALAPMLDTMPEPPRLLPAQPVVSPRRDLPARRGGLAQKAVLGGQRIFLRTGEYADGQLGEVSLSLPQGAPPTRALVECLSQVIGTALQHGAPLAEILEAMAGTRFGTPGAVEGDSAVPRATSPLDYAARALAHHYLPDAALPPVQDTLHDAGDEPLLPLQLSAEAPPARRRGLRVVK